MLDWLTDRRYFVKLELHLQANFTFRSRTHIRYILYSNMVDNYHFCLIKVYCLLMRSKIYFIVSKIFFSSHLFVFVSQFSTGLFIIHLIKVSCNICNAQPTHLRGKNCLWEQKAGISWTKMIVLMWRHKLRSAEQQHQPKIDKCCLYQMRADKGKYSAINRAKLTY